MKKILLILLVLLLISVAAFYGYSLLFPQPKIASLEDIVSKEAIMYLYADKPLSKIKQFQETQFFRELTALPLYEKQVTPFLNKAREKLPLLPELLEKETAIALFSPLLSFSRQDRADVGDFLLLLRINPKRHSTVKKALATSYLSLTEKNQAEFSRYKAVKITNYMFPEADMIIGYALLSDVLVVSNHKGVLQATIDLYKKDKTGPLSSDRDFQKMGAKIRKDNLFWGYINNRLYNQKMQDNLERAQSKDTSGLAKASPFFKLLNVFAASSFYLIYDEPKEGFVYGGYQLIDYLGLDPEIRNLFVFAQPIDKKIFSFIPADIIGYAAASIDYLSYWAFFKKVLLASAEQVIAARMQADPRYAGLKDKIEEGFNFQKINQTLTTFLGVDLEKDLIPLLGNNVGIILVGFADVDFTLPAAGATTVSPAPAIPVIFPEIYAFIQVKDANRAQELAQSIAKNLVDNINRRIREDKAKAQEERQGISGRALGQPAQAPLQTETALQTEGNSSLAAGVSETALPPATIPSSTAPPEEKDSLKLKGENYNELEIKTLEIADLPVDFIQPNYCFLDDYVIFSLSTSVTKKIIDLSKAKGRNINDNFRFASLKGSQDVDNTQLLFFDLERLSSSIKASRLFNSPLLLQRTPAGKSIKEYLDEFFRLLGNIPAIIFSSKPTEDDIKSMQLYIKLKGLN